MVVQRQRAGFRLNAVVVTAAEKAETRTASLSQCLINPTVADDNTFVGVAVEFFETVVQVVRVGFAGGQIEPGANYREVFPQSRFRKDLVGQRAGLVGA